jgi:hypothetical protein
VHVQETALAEERARELEAQRAAVALESAQRKQQDRDRERENAERRQQQQAEEARVAAEVGGWISGWVGGRAQAGGASLLARTRESALQTGTRVHVCLCRTAIRSVCVCACVSRVVVGGRHGTPMVPMARSGWRVVHLQLDV